MNQRTITAGHQDFIHCSQIILPHPQAMATVCFTSCRKFPRLSPPATWNSVYYPLFGTEEQAVTLNTNRQDRWWSPSAHRGCVIPYRSAGDMEASFFHRHQGRRWFPYSPTNQGASAAAFFLHQQGSPKQWTLSSSTNKAGSWGSTSLPPKFAVPSCS